ncbi:MAG TPA: histidinol phosphate phosphatase domain-containing protein [Methanomicrobiales archaeon]|nr:histidinol phosphate phosphatase domain-containing protein [Methanomicrobiales archaeon]
MTGEYDLHTHTTLSDGEMLPIELIRRVSVLGYKTIAIADHVDSSNLSHVIRALSDVTDLAAEFGVHLLCGVEITHVPPSHIPILSRRARSEGADVVVVHGETVVEPVAPGTNRAACSCPDVDVLAHPGLISPADALLAAENQVALEVTSRGGHNRTNGHVVRIAREAGCTIVVDSDAHGPSDILDERARKWVALGAGLTDTEAHNALSLNIETWLRRRD